MNTLTRCILVHRDDDPSMLSTDLPGMTLTGYAIMPIEDVAALISRPITKRARRMRRLFKQAATIPATP